MIRSISSILVAVALVCVIRSGEAVPVDGVSTVQKITCSTPDITELRQNAQFEIFKIHQQMTRLEPLVTVSTHYNCLYKLFSACTACILQNGTFDLFHQTCFERSNAICEVVSLRYAYHNTCML